MKEQKSKFYKVSLIAVLLSLMNYHQISFAYEVNTHSAVNQYIAQNSLNRFSLNDYLKNQLGMQEGIDTYFKNGKTQKVFLWIGDGGVEEDDGLRLKNHFLNPITNKGILPGYSALEWAMLPVNTQDASPISSWNDVRCYYLRALTEADKTARDEWFTRTFQGIGQIMHLVQDLAVPAHARTNYHMVGDKYEKWFIDKKEKAPEINTYLPYKYSPPPNASLILIRLLFDTDRYDGNNPEDTLTNYIGLAEYTNANFYSRNTLNSAEFTYPKTDENKKHSIQFAGPKGTYVREYYLKDCNDLPYCNQNADKNYKGYVLRAVDFNVYWIKKIPNPLNPNPKIPILDSVVHRDYAQLLIPRAIGYSAAALKYFFRGQLDVTMGVGSLTIKNVSRETMSGGKFYLYYDNSNDERKSIEISNGEVSTLAKDGEGEQTISFNQPTETVKSYTLVYKGQLGGESNAVIGKVIENVIWEPWTINPKTKDPADLKVNHNWIMDAYPSGRTPFNIITNANSETVLEYRVNTGDSTSCDGIDWRNGGDSNLNIPIPQKQLFIKIKSNISGASAPGDNFCTSNCYYNLLYLIDIHGKELLIVFSSNYWFGAALNRHPNSITIPKASTGSPDAEDDGTVAISLSPYLSDAIVTVGFVAAYDSSISGYWTCDFIDFK